VGHPCCQHRWRKKGKEQNQREWPNSAFICRKLIKTKTNWGGTEGRTRSGGGDTGEDRSMGKLGQEGGFGKRGIPIEREECETEVQCP